IADNVGDNVGDVAGMGADLYESYVGSIVATATLGITGGLGFAGFSLPFILAGAGIIASMIGTFFVKTGEDASQSSLLAALRKGVFSASAITAVMTFVLVWFVLGKENMGIAWSVIIGLGAGILIGLATEYFTSSSYRPVKGLAETSLTGPATIVIGGLSIGMMSTVVPVVIVSAAIMGSYVVAGGLAVAGRGIYGIAIAAVGMLSTLGITLATDAYGPVADNAGGNAEMAHLGPEVRKRTDALDSLGNTTAATGKGFAIGSAALTALALISAYKESVIMNGGTVTLDLLSPLVLIGLFIGTMMPFVFGALTMSAVGRAGGKIVVEVRRQFKEIKGIMEGTAKPDYASCVNIVTKAAQKEMIVPSLLAILVPVAMGFFLGTNAAGGLLIGATASGFVLAVMMANSGGAWDNAKKYIEEGNHGGKGSAAHKAAVVGDTVGDPFKDTSGPAMNILIKLMSMVSIVTVAWVVKNTLIK
ncbi:MAG: sodium-translocating pyrophosphatase, partial [Candidatus Omnitrophota bacterium]